MAIIGTDLRVNTVPAADLTSDLGMLLNLTASKFSIYEKYQMHKLRKKTKPHTILPLRYDTVNILDTFL